MVKRLFVGGIPYTTTDKDLVDVFSKVGNVISAKVITDKFTGQGKGFGFVEMESEDEAKRAINELNNTSVGGRAIVVNEARPQEARSGGGFDQNRGNRSFGRKDYSGRGHQKRW